MIPQMNTDVNTQLTVAMVRHELAKQAGIIGAPPESYGDVMERIVCPICDGERGEGSGNADLVCFIKPEGWLNFVCHHCGSKSNKGDRPAYIETAEGELWLRPGCHTTKAMERERTQYEIPKPLTQRGHTPHIEEWWASRGISKATRDTYGVFDMYNGLPKTRINDAGMKEQIFIPAIVFPYRDRGGNVTNYKKRSCEKPVDGEWGKKRFSQSAGHRPTIYNEYGFFECPEFKFHKKAIITEGEMDVLALYESFVQVYGRSSQNITTLPNGSAKKDNHARAALIRDCYPQLVSRCMFLLAGDNDANGRALMSAIAEMLRGTPEQRANTAHWPEWIFIVQWPYGCKDANAVLMQYGAQAVCDAVNSAIPMSQHDAMYPPHTLNEPQQKIPTQADPTDVFGREISAGNRALIGLA